MGDPRGRKSVAERRLQNLENAFYRDGLDGFGDDELTNADVVPEFFGVAKALGNTGVAAYAGAAPTVSNDDVFGAAIGIHSVEARHAGFLDDIDGTIQFPNVVDEPKTTAEVRTIAGQFIVSECSETAAPLDGARSPRSRPSDATHTDARRKPTSSVVGH